MSHQIDTSEFPEIDIQTTVTVLLHRFHTGKIELPVEVDLCLPGFEVIGWRRAAERVLREARAKQKPLVIQ